jgi:hypothetical protein
VTTPGKPDPDRGARFLQKLLTEDPEHLDVASDEEIERQMDAAGIVVKNVPTAEELIALAEKRANEQAPKAAAAAAPPVRRARAAPLAAAVALGALGMAALLNRGAIVAYLKGEPIGPDQPWAPPTAPTTEQQRAAAIRGEAYAACAAQRWTECGSKLDEAAALDPAGERDPRVVAVRKAMDDAKREEEEKGKLKP